MGASLDIEGLSVSTARGRCLLHIAELTAAPGTLLGVRGPSGAGKSTFLYAIAGLLDKAQGKVKWQGKDILDLSPEQRTAFRAASVGMVFQDFMLFDEMSPMANATVAALFAPRSELEASAADLMNRMGVPVEARGVASYSGGEKQRIAVVRAMAGTPDIVLADEPTASLDRRSADRLIADLVDRVRQSGATLVAVSHDMRLLEAMTRVVTLENGRVVADTEHAG